MRRILLSTAAAATLALSLAACSMPASDDTSAMSDAGMSTSQNTTMTDDMDTMTDAAMEKSGEFMGLNDKMVSGMVTVTDETITLSDFASDEGPDLHVYLTNGTDEAAITAGMQIDAVSFDTASQTFMLDGVDIAGYENVVIYCNKAKAVFGAADLS